VESRTAFRSLERLFIVVLLLSSMGLVDALTRPSLSGRDPNILSTEVPLSTALIESAIYVWGAVLVLVHWRHVFSAARAVWPVIALVALAPLSIAWSIQPILTLRRSAFLLGSMILGIYLGERFSVEDLARLLAYALCLMILASVLLYCVAPASVIDVSSGNAWKGLTVHKNSFGGYMALAVALLLLIRFRRFRSSRYAFLAAAAILVLLSRSATSLVVCALMIGAMPFWRLIRLQGKGRLVVCTVVPLVILVVVYSVFDNTEWLLTLLGRDSTLTGRTQLWSMVVAAISKHPILGYGYGAFWTGFNGESLDVLVGIRWLARGSDNGYLDLCLSLGVLGLSVCLYMFVTAFQMAFRYVRSEPSPIGLWPVSFFTFFLAQNVSQSQLLGTRSLDFLVFVAITTSLALKYKHKTSLSRVPEYAAQTHYGNALSHSPR
jgi:exopolysaccharide production protein ExoQ